MISGYSNFTGSQYDIITTTEKVVGEWLNNKPIYEKMYQGSLVKNTTYSFSTMFYYNVDTNLSGITPVYMTGYVMPEGGGAIPIPMLRPMTTSWYLRLGYQKQRNFLTIHNQSNAASTLKDLSGVPFMVVIRYIKD